MRMRAVLVGSLVAVVGGLTGLGSASAMVAPDLPSTPSVTADPSVVPSATPTPEVAVTLEPVVTPTPTVQVTVAPKPVVTDPVAGRVTVRPNLPAYTGPAPTSVQVPPPA